MNSEILLGVGMFTVIVLSLVVLILVARSWLVSSGDVTIEINGERKITVPAGGKLLQTLAGQDIFLSSACGGGGSCAQCKCIVESGGGEGAANIKSHHNVGGLPEDMTFELVEPLRTLFKDEVRAVGRELGLPDYLVNRQPFPGPGLGIRIIGEVTRERLDILRAADLIAREELTAAGLDQEIWQCPVVLLADVRSVGVQGDGRTYGHPIVLRPVSSEDAMTADWTRLPYDVLARISTRITNSVPEVNRVVLDVTSKPPATIEWE